MVNLKTKPFYLNQEQLDWVNNTLNSMSVDEKIGQLFTLLKAVPGVDEKMLSGMISQCPFGGFRWQNQNAEGAYRQNTLVQKLSKIPALIAANCDEGGNGAAPEGAFVATATECGAGEGTENAYHVGYVASKESSALAANMLFNPVVDIYKNWRNTIVNTRAFSDDPDTVLANARAYIRGAKAANPNVACTAKHFPGDGVDELDQHLSLNVNSLSVEEWEESFGKVYRNLIEEGLEAIMVGHIALPAYSKKLRPGMSDQEIKPATNAPELLTDLLRKDMGFNGLITTDATHMIGLAGSGKREDYLPEAIIAGCDMILFTADTAEDVGFVKKAYEDGRLTEERLNDAVTRILGMKAHLNLHHPEIAMPSEEGLKDIGCEKHRRYGEEAAENCITLVKDTVHNLPLDPQTKKRCFLVYVGSTPTSKGYTGDPTKKVVIEELEKAGFEVDACPSFYDLEVENGVNFRNMVSMMDKGSIASFREKHDFALIVLNVKGYAQQNEVRMSWSCNHSKESPWYNEEIPTIAMSLNYTNHLIDLAQVHTYINAYGSNRVHIQKAIEKMKGLSEFKGKAQENVFCDRWDTRR